MKMWVFLLSVLILTGFVILGFLLDSFQHSDQAKVVLEWSTASELNTAGFNIFRSENSTDIRVLVNESLIPASSDSQTGGNYQYIDTAVRSGQEYFYFLEDVSNDGIKNIHGPVKVIAQNNWKFEWKIGIVFLVVDVLGIVFLVFFYRKNNAGGSL